MKHFVIVADVSDINECLTGHSGCEQECRNTPGNFRCLCRDGYMLADDYRSVRHNRVGY